MKQIEYFETQDIKTRLTYPQLIAALEKDFKDSIIHVPTRLHESISKTQEILIMPAWNKDFIGIKLVSLFPENSGFGKETINGLYCLFDNRDGHPLAVFDHREITARRTAAVSALAASKLSRKESQTLLVIGTGRLAPALIEAHKTVRPLKHILIWGRTYEKARQLADQLPFDVSVVDNLKRATSQADIMTLATRSHEALIQSDWISEGTHLDLVGAYRPDMREVDSQTIKRSRLYVDSYQGALKEAGDLIIPIHEGLITKQHIRADLSDLLNHPDKGRKQAHDVTLFKSVGTALADLTAVKLIYRQNKK